MKILVVEDNPTDYEMIEEALCSITDYFISIQREETLSEGLTKLKTNAFDVCLFDLQLPDSPIKNTLKVLDALAVETPVVVLSALSDPDVYSCRGIQANLSKNQITPTSLSNVCLYAKSKKRSESF